MNIEKKNILYNAILETVKEYGVGMETADIISALSAVEYEIRFSLCEINKDFVLIKDKLRMR